MEYSVNTETRPIPRYVGQGALCECRLFRRRRDGGLAEDDVAALHALAVDERREDAHLVHLASVREPVIDLDADHLLAGHVLRQRKDIHVDVMVDLAAAVREGDLADLDVDAGLDDLTILRRRLDSIAQVDRVVQHLGVVVRGGAAFRLDEVPLAAVREGVLGRTFEEDTVGLLQVPAVVRLLLPPESVLLLRARVARHGLGADLDDAVAELDCVLEGEHDAPRVEGLHGLGLLLGLGRLGVVHYDLHFFV